MLPDLFDGRSIVICIGPGGVGKTTISALLGVVSAEVGKRALCVTVDPSERLAESLGLRKGDEPIGSSGIFRPRYFDPSQLDEKIRKVRDGLDAMIIHGEWVIDLALSRYLPRERWESVTKGRMYHYLKQTLRGLHELASIVLVHDLASTGRWDIVIVDTAPSAHAIDFLGMPRRIAAAIHSPAFALLAGGPMSHLPGGAALGKASSLVLKAMGKIVGLEFLSELAEFLQVNREGLENICAAAEKIRSGLRGGMACIVQVTTARAEAIDESLMLHKKINEEGFETYAFIINRTLPFSALCDEDLCGQPQGCGEELTRKLRRNFEEMRRISQLETKEVERLVKGTPNVSTYLKIPQLDEEVHNLQVIERLLHFIEPLGNSKLESRKPKTKCSGAGTLIFCP